MTPSPVHALSTPPRPVLAAADLRTLQSAAPDTVAPLTPLARTPGASPTSALRSRSNSVPGMPRHHTSPRITIPSLPPLAPSSSTASASPRNSPRHFQQQQQPHQHFHDTGYSPTRTCSYSQGGSPSPRHSGSRQVNPESTPRSSRTPRRDSSLASPLSAVLPALPPLIPVRTAATLESPPAAALAPFTPASATTIPSDTLATGGLDQEHDHRTNVLFAPQSATSSPVIAIMTSSPKSTASLNTGTESGPHAWPNARPSSVSHGQETQGHQSVAKDQVKAVSEKDSTAPETRTTALQELSDQEQWPELPRVYLERIKETVSKAELGNLLSKYSDPFHQAVLRVHMESFDFRRDPIDLALRKFLLDFHFPKEAQQIDRVLEAFATRYHTCNPHLFRSSEVVYTIAFSLMLLHTDAHNKNVRFKMSKEQYVKQAKSIDGVNTIPADILEVLYDNITYLKFVYAEDELDVDGQRMTEVQPSSGSWFPRRRTASNQRSDSYSMIRHGSIAQLTPDLSDLIPFRWPYYWKGTIEMVDNVHINNQFTRAPLAPIPGLCSKRYSQHVQLQGSGAAPCVSGANDPPGVIPFVYDDPHPNRDQQKEFSGIVGERAELPRGQVRGDCAELKIVKQGILARKIDIENGKKSAVRGWRDLGVVLSGSQLLFFTDLGWFQQQRASFVGVDPNTRPEASGSCLMDLSGSALPMPQALISTLDSIAVVDSSYQKYPHVFRLVCPNGKQYLFRAESEYDMNDWMAKINYASAFKTAGVRLRNYHVAWASDVVWIKDDQGRHQLRRRQQKPPAPQPELPDGRAELVQAKIKEIDRQINICSASLAAELRLARGLEVMIPLQNSTRQKIVQSAAVVGKRLRHLMLERTKLDCFRTILERDLAVVAACQEQGLGVSFPGSLSGTTEFSPSSISSRTLRTGSFADVQDQAEADYVHLRHPSAPYPPSLSMHDHLDNPKEEFVLNSSRTSQSSNRSAKAVSRPRLNLPDLQRTVSENALPEVKRMQPPRGSEAPMGPMAIQAAIIDAARGNVGSVPSTMSSPDPNRYQDTYLSPGRSPLQDSHVPSSSSLLSPESPSARTSGRSRALSMPGQRPTMMPRTVSIYSSSSQTASRLRRMLEQGLGHLKWGNSSSGGSSLRSETSFPVSDDSIVHVEAGMDMNTATSSDAEQYPYNEAVGQDATSRAAFRNTHGAQDQDHHGQSSPLKRMEMANGRDRFETLLPALPLNETMERPRSLDTTTPSLDSFVDDGDDDVAIHHEHQASSSLGQSFVMMVTTDYVTDEADKEGEDSASAGESDVESEASSEHAGSKAPRIFTTDLNLPLPLDVPSLSITLD
ncbi:hypothetical protein BGZ70_001627 [Mortierella alpina]|uniref:Guanyl-nucleotide exchange factor n=1 Tax=Mortierella alpina TaxID=64518 RepID=A0A9P6IVY7_MORAP|nr:hypothetical protein BGZ70_001627 [Mortierella alpina]